MPSGQSGEQNKAIAGWHFLEMSAGKAATADELAALTSTFHAAWTGSGRGSQDARLARIAAHVANEAAMLRRRS